MKFGIIGNDQMVQSCIQVLNETPGAEISFVLYDVSKLNSMNPIDVFCEKNGVNARGITKLNTPENWGFIKNYQPDYLLSISNFFVIREDILSIPEKGTINFHNSAPSRYHGLNIPSWVIINGEKHHGVMWHFVERTIDTGDVIVFEDFQVAKNETASSLMVKCIKKGIELFPAVIGQVFKNKVNRIPQLGNSSYYGKKDYPHNKGYIDFGQRGEEIERLVRGLNYLPFKNPYLYAKIKHKEKELIINAVEIEVSKEGTISGKIVVIDEESFQVECRDSVINIIDAMDESFNEYEGNSIADYLGVRPGDIV